ncbi:uncharacterized protein PSFLO_01067 [Pseudozyma flocculosa]|uniref:Uncharacterized protein n=1 Tax=Pseudozyma flocculosa TaxID=84751 RepID=A0A5C3EVP9_9BASI|nr:uncharacterized protein PSFLO_01067 [Pseudozyma flocculosa]
MPSPDEPPPRPPRSTAAATASSYISSLPTDLPASQVDSYIASLILRDSTARASQYDKHGIAAYLDGRDPSSSSPAAATPGPREYNKRFLASVLRNVQGHNHAVIRQQLVDATRANRHRYRGGGYSSKMDKYFDVAYDPTTDVTLDDVTDPRTGLIRARLGDGGDKRASTPPLQVQIATTRRNTPPPPPSPSSVSLARL